jgi:hypothetical protein
VRNLVLCTVLAFLAWQGYQHFRPGGASATAAGMPAVVRGGAAASPIGEAGRFSCDGRTHCSQMTSCEEATFFLRHCPGTKMDGDGDGIPCEQQWCR